MGAGDQNDPSTLILLPASAIGSDGQDGVLGPYDQATFYLRFVIPPTAALFKALDIQLAVDCDIN